MSYKDRPIQQHTCCDFLLAKHKFLCCPPSHGYIHLGLQLANVLAVHLFVLDERRLKTIDTTTQFTVRRLISVMMMMIFAFI